MKPKSSVIGDRYFMDKFLNWLVIFLMCLISGLMIYIVISVYELGVANQNRSSNTVTIIESPSKPPIPPVKDDLITVIPGLPADHFEIDRDTLYETNDTTLQQDDDDLDWMNQPEKESVNPGFLEWFRNLRK